MFDRVYQKFLKTVEEFDLISKETQKIVIATSGGKDANIMTELLYRYQRDYRNDIVLELANATIPRWKYDPSSFIDKADNEDYKKLLLEETKYVQEHERFWKERGINTVYISHSNENIDKEIYESSIPCANCFVAQKQALFQYLEKQDKEQDVRLATGLTKWDMLYMALTHILRCDGMTWKQLKEINPERYQMDLMHFATFSPYPKINLGIPGRTIYGIEPIIALSDIETKEFANTLDLPIIPDLCVELFGAKFSSDKRFFDNFMKKCAQEEVNLVKNGINTYMKDTLDPLYSNYSDILALMEKTELLPPLEEFDGILYEAYGKELMKSAVADE